jgi:GxxExxY protein
MRSQSADLLNGLTSSIIGFAIRIHRHLGPGLLEGAYAACLRHELSVAGLPFESQKAVPLVYDGVTIDCAYRADFIVDGALVIEVKAVDALVPIHMRQLHTYACLAGVPVGLLLNFGAPTMRQGVRRVVNGFPGGRGAEGAEIAGIQRRDR